MASALLVAAAALAGTPTGPPTVAAPSAQGSTPVVAPCDPEIQREVDRRVLARGETVEVTVRWSYRCHQQKKRRINVLLLVENTEVLRGNGAHRELLDNLKGALTDFVVRMDYEEGSTGGLTLYAKDYTHRVALRGGRDGQVALLQGIRAISVEPIGNAAGAPSAIRDATERLPTHTGDEDATNVIIVVDGGAPVITRPLIDYPTACGAAHTAGVVLVVVGLDTAGSRGSGCASPGWFRRSQAASGSDLKELFLDLADALMTQGKRVEADEYHERPRLDLHFVPGSGVPRDPDYAFAGELGWYAEDGGQHAERVLRYRLRVDEEAEVGVTELSEQAGMSLYFLDGTKAQAPAANPSICIHEPDDTSPCAGFPPPDQTATPPSEPTATSSPTNEPTAVPSTEPTAVPTALPTSIPTDTPGLPDPTALPATPTVLAPTTPSPPPILFPRTIHLPLAYRGGS